MASDSDTTTTTKQPYSNTLNVADAAAAQQLRPELLMAAQRGDWRRLDDLMSRDGGAAPVPEVMLDIDVEDDDEHPAAKPGHAYGQGSSALHVIASGGDGDAFLMSATVIYEKARHLVGTANANGDTPFHCAARGGNTKMVSHLIDLARRNDGGAASRVQAELRKRNEHGETALHEALRSGDKEMVSVLMSVDPELARVPRASGTSPLYLAILLGYDDIAEQLYDKDKQLSYSGPVGQNALHVAVLKSERMTEKLLSWNKSLIKQGDRSGSTPLHFAASEGSNTSTGTAKLLLDADESLAYQSDNKRSFPIHVAASGNNRGVVRVLLEKCPDCAELRDAQGRTFLHIAVFKKHCRLVNDACRMKRFASIMNMQDNDGNTALHLAVKAGRAMTMYPLMWNKDVQLNLPNKEGKTALDLSWSKKPTRVFFELDPRIRIHNLLMYAGARTGVHRCDEKEHVPDINEEKELAEKIKESTTTIGVVSVLIISVSFAAAFQVPGGYSTGGTPVLINKYSFEAFIMANNLAAFCSAMATISLMYAGVTILDIHIRSRAFIISIMFVNSSARSLAVAFAFGTYALLAPVARAIVAITWLLTGFLLLDIAWLTCMMVADEFVLLNRKGIRACLRFACSIIAFPLSRMWPYVVIAGSIAYSKIHNRIH